MAGSTNESINLESQCRFQLGHLLTSTNDTFQHTLQSRSIPLVSGYIPALVPGTVVLLHTSPSSPPHLPKLPCPAVTPKIRENPSSAKERAGLTKPPCIALNSVAAIVYSEHVSLNEHDSRTAAAPSRASSDQLRYLPHALCR
ncbi:hypothetical protein IAQ61_011529 [Plenodomus lingam]|uniref:uncharacterized protein n=1 Tax=Leptosphaeria maculans TaxID=5022 RepID=UPI0033345A3A|nr:hypothetical protein IAQ61_011529 [Plenodomus lingam]